MKLPFFPLVLGLGLVLLLPLYATAQKASFEFFTTQEGLSGGLTTRVIQDPQGFIWLLNDYKLHRFDGQKFEVFMPPAGFPGSGEKLLKLMLFQDTLLLGLSSTHLLTLHLKQDRWEVFQTPFHGRNSRHIYLINEHPPGEIWIGEQPPQRDTLRIWRFSEGKFNALPLHTILLNEWSIPSFGPKGKIYFVGGNKVRKQGNQLRIWSPETDSVLRYSLPLLEAGGKIHHLSLTASNQLLLHTSTPARSKEGLPFEQHAFYHGSPDTYQLTPSPVNRFLAKPGMGIRAFKEVQHGHLWLPGYQRKLFFYDCEKDTLFNFSKSFQEKMTNTTFLFAPFEDQAGSVWFGSHIGLLRGRILSDAIQGYWAENPKACRGYCSVRSIAEDPQGNIFAQYYGGLVQFNPHQASSYTYLKQEVLDLPSPAPIYYLDRKLWFSNGKAFKPGEARLQNIPGSIAGPNRGEGLFFPARQGGLWWIFSNQLSYLDPTKTPLRWETILSFPDQDFVRNTALYVDPQRGLIYLGRKGKLLQYNPKTQKKTWFDFETLGFERLDILAIEADPQQNLWLASHEGLIQFQPQSGRSKRYTKLDGLPHDFVCGILPEGDSCLWLSTYHGLSRFHIPSETFTNFYEEDGLSHNEFNQRSYLTSRDGRMYFGGLKGINAFYPQELMASFRQQQAKTQLALSSFEYVDEKAGKTERKLLFSSSPSLHIYYHHRSFTFEYALTNFNNPSEVAYSFRMKGYQDTWSAPSKFNFTRFSSLPTGEYDFEVKARDSHGRWHPDQLRVKVIVHPAWWASGWAILGYACLSLGLLYLIYRFFAYRWELQLQLKAEHAEALRLKKLDSFKTKFYTNITHEFRTPLTVILGMTEQIRNQPNTYLESGTQLIKSNGNHLLRLINQLLSLSKLENHSLQLKWEHGDLVAHLRYLTESFQAYANSQNILLQFHSDEGQLFMDFDPEQMKQIMINLLSNALKFTPSGGKVSVKMSPDHKQEKVSIRVCDTGIGIDPAKLDKIFDRFYQVDGTSTRKGEGTGIGLAHTQEVVKLMGGEILVESKVGKGSSFTVQLPVRLELKGSIPAVIPSGQPPVVPFQLPVKCSTGQASSGPHVLLIEDNPAVIDYLTSCLQDRFQVAVALNGKIGIEKARTQIPDLIISDIMMPEKDGFKVCETLRGDERTSHIPLILLTAKADPTSRLDGWRRGADAYLLKPFDKEELLLRVETLLERQQRLVSFLSQKFVPQQVESGPGLPQETLHIQDQFIEKVRDIIEAHYADQHFGLMHLCQELGMSRTQLYRKMKALIDMAPSDFIRRHRLAHAHTLLKTTQLNVSEVAWQVGFKDLSHFSKAYYALYGELPSSTSR
ncbi:MAG: ATP-binding protein [Bacteroidota bacterium]